MFGIEIIEVGIGLVFTYLAISTLCSGIVEVVVKLLSYRTKMLKEALHKILGSGSQAVVKDIYSHHLIHGGAMDRSKEPDYIDKADFALALVDSFCEFSPGSEKVEAVRSGLMRIQDEKLRIRLLKMLDESVGDVVEFRKRVGDWFDTSMQDVSKWYRSRMRKMVTVAAAVVVVTMNVDSFRMAKLLYNDNDLRQSTVAAAQNYVEKNLPVFDAADTSAANLARIDSTDLLQMVRNLETQFDQAEKLPIGWTNEPGPWKERQLAMDAKGIISWILMKLFGLVITIAAVNMGAPYWRDQLKSLLNLRAGMAAKSTAEAPAKAPEPQPINVVVNNVPAVPANPDEKPAEDEPDTEIV